MAKRTTGASAIVAGLNTPDDADEPQLSVIEENDQPEDNYEDERAERAPSANDTGCAIRQLPARLQFRAADVAARINPVNEPVIGLSAAVSEGVLPTPLAIAVATAKYWGPSPRKLTVSFMETTPANLRRRILGHLNAWTKTGSVQFVETGGTGQVRISRGPGGYWSYLGTDILLIPRNRPTMNLQSFTMTTSDAEYRRVVRHEAGHTLAFPHEHMRKELVARIDRQKAYDFFLRTYGWDRTTVDQQVLTTLDDRTIMFTPPDQDSIMCYQLPGAITRDGRPIRGGSDINSTDYAFAGRIYPKPSSIRQVASAVADDYDWPEEEDVESIAS